MPVRRLAVGLCDRVSVYAVVEARHSVARRELVHPRCVGTQLVAVNERIADSYELFSVEYRCHVRSLPFGLFVFLRKRERISNIFI